MMGALLRCAVIVIVFGYIYSECVKTQPNELMCTNVLNVAGFYRHIKRLTLINSFIARARLLNAFPDLTQISVKGSMRYEQCLELQDTDYKVTGCEHGGLCR